MTIAIAGPTHTDFGLTELHSFDPEQRRDHAVQLAYFWAQYAVLQQFMLEHKDSLPKPTSHRSSERAHTKGKITLPHWFIGCGKQTLPASPAQRKEIGNGDAYGEYFVRDDGELVFDLTADESGAATDDTLFVRPAALTTSELEHVTGLMVQFRQQYAHECP